MCLNDCKYSRGDQHKATCTKPIEASCPEEPITEAPGCMMLADPVDEYIAMISGRPEC